MLYRQTLLYLPAQVLGPVFQLISMVAWTHFLPPAEMGVFALLTAAQELIFVGTTSWLSLYTVRYYDPAGDNAARKRYLDTETAALLFASAVSILAVWLLTFVIDTAWTPALFATAAAYTLSRGLATHLSDRARAEHDTLTYSVLQIFWPVLGFVFGLVLLTLFPPSAATLLAGYAAAQGLALVIAMMRLEFGRQPMMASREVLRGAMIYGLPLLIGGAIVWLANNGLRFIVEAARGAEAVGLVTVGWGLGLRAAAFAAMMVAVAGFPLAVRKSREEGMQSGQDQLVRNGVLLLATLAPATAGLWAISSPLIDLAVAVEYREMTKAVLPLALVCGALRNIRQHFSQHVFLLHEKPNIPVYNDIVDASATLLGVTIGLWLGGLTGSVLGAAIGAGFGLLVTSIWGWRSYGFAMPILDMVRVGAATLAMMLAVKTFAPAPTPASIVLAIVLGGIVYAGALSAMYPALTRRALAGLTGKLQRAS